VPAVPIFVLTTFFRQLPPELEEAAGIDGANSWQMFIRIMVPMVRPAVATVVVFRLCGPGSGDLKRPPRH
jgi:raffinose/stachyose/melibiose transport system permease protein